MNNAELFYECATAVWHRWWRVWAPHLVKEDAIQDAVLACCRREAQFNPDRASARTYFSLVCHSSMNEERLRATRTKRNRGKSSVSLNDEPFESCPLWSLIGGDDLSPLAEAMNREATEQIAAAVSKLPGRWQTVVTGVADGRKLRDDAALLGVSHQRIEQMRKKVLDRLRLPLKALVSD